MKFELITIWYNEEFLAPFFLNHYRWVDKIRLIIDADTNDDTVAIASQYPNVTIEYFKFPDMMDDTIKAKKFNQAYHSVSNAEYVILVDSDEFIFCNDVEKPVSAHIAETAKDIYFVHLWQIYKHEMDAPLDPTLPVWLQRRHGDPNMNSEENLSYIKPCVLRSGLNVIIGRGNHFLCVENVTISILLNDGGKYIETLNQKRVTISQKDMLQGSHWRLVDVEETIKRRIINRKWRQSKHNLENGYTIQYHNVTKQDILNEYEANKNNPIVIYNRNYS